MQTFIRISILFVWVLQTSKRSCGVSLFVSLAWFFAAFVFCGFAFVSTFCKIGKNPLGKTHNPDTDSASFVFHGGRGGHSAIIEIQKQRQRHGVRSYEKSKNTVGFVFLFLGF